MFKFNKSKQKTVNQENIDDQDLINNLRFLSLSAIKSSKPGNFAKALQATPIFYALFKDHFTSANSGAVHYLNDLLVVSKDYGNSFLKTILLASNISENTLTEKTNFPNINLGLPHNVFSYENFKNGYALDFAVGLALSDFYLCKNQGTELARKNIYCVIDQTDFTTGNFYESLAIAGKFSLGNLIVLADFSGVEKQGLLSNHTITNQKLQVQSHGWHYITVGDGSNPLQISKAISKAQLYNRPVFIEINTVAAHGSSYAGTKYAMQMNLSDDEYKTIVERFDYEVEENKFMDGLEFALANSINKRFQKRISHFESNFVNLQNIEKTKVNEFLLGWMKSHPIVANVNFLTANSPFVNYLQTHEKTIGFVISNDKLETGADLTSRVCLLSNRYCCADGIAQGFLSAGFFDLLLYANKFVSFNMLINHQDNARIPLNYVMIFEDLNYSAKYETCTFIDFIKSQSFTISSSESQNILHEKKLNNDVHLQDLTLISKHDDLKLAKEIQEELNNDKVNATIFLTDNFSSFLKQNSHDLKNILGTKPYFFVNGNIMDEVDNSVLLSLNKRNIVVKSNNVNVSTTAHEIIAQLKNN
ncbi:thiamine pyrophosphate-dependent enzyme [[Mycoplasma] testudinis]|uniref:hypothetical protein n=1 Tax=[Mycoplasma] testudinis TaxID=33924 RepID=UPI00048245FF|nr:hypothetical protein [[Mycoplasma] testudinis]